VHGRSNGRILSSNPYRPASLAPALYSLHEVVGNKPSISGHF